MKRRPRRLQRNEAENKTMMQQKKKRSSTLANLVLFFFSCCAFCYFVAFAFVHNEAGEDSVKLLVTFQSSYEVNYHNDKEDCEV